MLNSDDAMNMSMTRSIYFGTDKTAEVIKRKEAAEKELMEKRKAKMKEHEERLFRVKQQKEAQRNEQIRMRQKVELQRQKEALDRRCAQLDKLHAKREAILTKNHQKTSRVVATNQQQQKKNNIYAFGSSTPRELHFLETSNQQQRKRNASHSLGSPTHQQGHEPLSSRVASRFLVHSGAVSKPGGLLASSNAMTRSHFGSLNSNANAAGAASAPNQQKTAPVRQRPADVKKKQAAAAAAAQSRSPASKLSNNNKNYRIDSTSPMMTQSLYNGRTLANSRPKLPFSPPFNPAATPPRRNERQEQQKTPKNVQPKERVGQMRGVDNKTPPNGTTTTTTPVHRRPIVRPKKEEIDDEEKTTKEAQQHQHIAAIIPIKKEQETTPEMVLPPIQPLRENFYVMPLLSNNFSSSSPIAESGVDSTPREERGDNDDVVNNQSPEIRSSENLPDSASTIIAEDDCNDESKLNETFIILEDDPDSLQAQMQESQNLFPIAQNRDSILSNTSVDMTSATLVQPDFGLDDDEKEETKDSSDATLVESFEEQQKLDSLSLQQSENKKNTTSSVAAQSFQIPSMQTPPILDEKRIQRRQQLNEILQKIRPAENGGVGGVSSSPQLVMEQFQSNNNNNIFGNEEKGGFSTPTLGGATSASNPLLSKIDRSALAKDYLEQRRRMQHQLKQTEVGANNNNLPGQILNDECDATTITAAACSLPSPPPFLNNNKIALSSTQICLRQTTTVENGHNNNNIKNGVEFAPPTRTPPEDPHINGHEKEEEEPPHPPEPTTTLVNFS